MKIKQKQDCLLQYIRWWWPTHPAFRLTIAINLDSIQSRSLICCCGRLQPTMAPLHKLLHKDRYIQSLLRWLLGSTSRNDISGIWYRTSAGRGRVSCHLPVSFLCVKLMAYWPWRLCIFGLQRFHAVKETSSLIKTIHSDCIYYLRLHGIRAQFMFVLHGVNN